LRQTRRSNRDSSVAACVQLAHKVRHPSPGVSTAKVIHTSCRAEKVARDTLAPLASSISRFPSPEQEGVDGVAGAGVVPGPAAGVDAVEVVDSRRLGGLWTLDRVCERVGIGSRSRAWQRETTTRPTERWAST